jgi:hypothetical protein
MTTAFFCVGAFVLCLAAANRSLRHGLLALLAVGYVYGILRANFPDTATYLTFDAAVLGVYVAQLWRPLSLEQRRRAVKVAASVLTTDPWQEACQVLPDVNTLTLAAAQRAYEQGGVGPDDLDLAEVYDLSTALELDWYESIGLCKEGEAEKLLRDGDTALGGRIPVNPSGGLACFGEAVPAQAIAQVCEVTCQLRGQAEGRQVEDAKVGLTINQGLFGHGSSVILTR